MEGWKDAEREREPSQSVVREIPMQLQIVMTCLMTLMFDWVQRSLQFIALRKCDFLHLSSKPSIKVLRRIPPIPSGSLCLPFSSTLPHLLFHPSLPKWHKERHRVRTAWSRSFKVDSNPFRAELTPCYRLSAWSPTPRKQTRLFNYLHGDINSRRNERLRIRTGSSAEKSTLLCLQRWMASSTVQSQRVTAWRRQPAPNKRHGAPHAARRSP